MNACVPMLKIVLLCNAIYRDFSNRRRVCSDEGRMTLIDQADLRTAQEVVKDEQRRVGRAEMADHGWEMVEVDVGNGIWYCSFGLLEEAWQGWFVVATELLDAGLCRCLQVVAADQVYNANHDDTKLWSDHSHVLLLPFSEGSTLCILSDRISWTMCTVRLGEDPTWLACIRRPEQFFRYAQVFSACPLIQAPSSTKLRQNFHGRPISES
jgi:hypothetical protein